MQLRIVDRRRQLLKFVKHSHFCKQIDIQHAKIDEQNIHSNKITRMYNRTLLCIYFQFEGSAIFGTKNLTIECINDYLRDSLTV